MDRLEADILVAGGGVAGLAATAAFAVAGFRTVCVDPAAPPRDGDAEAADLRSTAFLMPSIRLLQRAGLWERLAPRAAALRIMRIADAGGSAPGIRSVADFVAEEAGEAVFGFNLPNWLLRREMAEALAEQPGATLRTGSSVARINPRSSGAVAILGDGAQVRAALVVAADGRDSPVRSALGIGVRRWGFGQKAVVFSVAHLLPHDGISTEIHRSGGPFTLVPLPDDPGGEHRSAVVWMETGPRAAALAAMPVPDFEAALNERACGVLGPLELRGARRLWPIIAQLADRLDGPRTALVAEAAHVVPPIGAQGLNMSLRDVSALLDIALAEREAGRDIGADAPLARYHRARHGDMLGRIAGIDLLNRAAMAEDQRLRDLRRAGLMLLHRAGPLRRAAMRRGLGAGGLGTGSVIRDA